MADAIVIGGADCVWADLERAQQLLPDAMIIACNHAGRDYPGAVDHWVTMHPEFFPMWMRRRAEEGRPPARQLWHAKHRLDQVQRAGLDSKPITSLGGSSGLLCVSVALHLGCEKVILAGLPLHKQFRHYDNPRPWHEANQYRAVWVRFKPEMVGRVRSLSGWTMGLLGAPDEAWVNERRTEAAG